jgi:hypothetical protein
MTKKQTLKKKRTLDSQVTEKQEGMLSDIRDILFGSFNKIPRPLITIFLISTIMALLAGAMLEISKVPQAEKEFLPVRLEQSVEIPAVDVQNLRGNWIYQTPEYAMSLTFIDDRFEWIIALGDITEAQFFGRGNYKLEGNVLVLAMRPDLGMPYDNEQPWLQYIPIAMVNLNAHVTMQGKNLLLTIPPSEQEQIISHTRAIFINNPQGQFEWVKR